MYILSNLKEPTDKQLKSLMKGVAKKAEKKSIKAHRIFFKEVDKKAVLTLKDWKVRIQAISKDSTR